MRRCLLLLTPMLLPATAQAAEETAEQPIIVTGERINYDVRHSSTATKTDTDLKDVPQAVSVISAEQIGDQAMRSIGDVLRYVPGVALNGGEGHRDQIAIRGNATTADFFLDGLRDDVQFYRPLYNLERVEVLKGPNAMIFGRGGGGGIVNRVTKRAEWRPFAAGSLSLDSHGAGDVELDLDAPLSATLAGRLNALAERVDNRRNATGRREAINPTLGWRPSERTRIDLGFEAVHDRRLIDRGVPSDARGRGLPSISDPARPLTGFGETLFGDRNVNRTRFDSQVSTLFVEHRFSEAVRMNAKALYGHYDKFYRNEMAASPADEFTSGGVTSTRVGIEAYQSRTKRRNLQLQDDLIAEVSTGPVRHTLVAGVDYSRQRTFADRQQGFFASSPFTASSNRRYYALLQPTLDLPAVTFTCVVGLGCNDATSHAEALGAYVQDQARIGEHVEILAGLRRDHFKLRVEDRVAGRTLRRSDDLWSPRLGLVLKPSEALSIYGSYSRSFLPQSGDQFSSLDPTTAALKPEKFVNREVGAKWRALPNLDLTLAAYVLDRANTRAADPVSGLTVLTGAQRSKGVELGVQGRVGRLSLSGGAALQDAEIRRTTTAAPAGRKVALVPRFQASLWGRYDVTRALGLGAGVYHQSKSFASISNAVVLPAFTRVDGAAFVKLTSRVEAQLNVENLLGNRYTALAGNDNNLTPGNPRTVRATLRFGF
ncbi:TonB-dependent siderophore receptor [Sphingomonas ginkgonis]|uniref:TonB-dependent siderophore receptor n=1 Tax=Sphingomonas ginkgonis TaxID=2315330 RepID=A0A429V7N4_9SPHN|nr:TonB-dependent siderophore receptor [Sphingomonas ginkgonis]RST29924.1 TonB-dependent siderophore receptor [Sphingomonas ginkgonis]